MLVRIKRLLTNYFEPFEFQTPRAPEPKKVISKPINAVSLSPDRPPSVRYASTSCRIAINKGVKVTYHDLFIIHSKNNTI